MNTPENTPTLASGKTANVSSSGVLNNRKKNKDKPKTKKKNVVAFSSMSNADNATRKIVRAELKQLSNAASAETAQLLSSLTMPKDYLVPRLGANFGADSTALANPWTRIDVEFPESSASVTLPTEMNPNYHQTFVYRDVLRFSLRPAVITTSVAAPLGFVYQGNMIYQPIVGCETFPKYPAEGLLPIQGEAIHGVSLYPGHLDDSDQHRGWLLTQGNQLALTLNSASYPLGSLVLTTVKFLEAGTWVPVAQFSQAPATGIGVFTYLAKYTGYYAISTHLTNIGSGILAGIPGIIAINGVPAGFPPATVFSSWSQNALPYLNDVSSFVKSIRITGVSTMYTNTASPLNRQGQITGLQVPKGTNFIRFTDFDVVSTDKKSITLDIVEGMYGFLKPTSSEDMRMRVFTFPGPAQTESIGGFNSELVFRIYPDTDYLCVIANVNIDAGQVGYITNAVSVEYTTLNQWISVKYGTVSEEEFQCALQCLTQVPQWHTNGLHWDDIWGWIKSTAKDVWSGIKEIAPLAAAAAPLLL